LSGGLLRNIVLFGGPKVGFSTNPDTKKHLGYIEINGEKIVCLAQGGECRYNSKFYTPGLNDEKIFKKTVLIDVVLKH